VRMFLVVGFDYRGGQDVMLADNITGDDENAGSLFVQKAV